jgi:hypothetical protein
MQAEAARNDAIAANFFSDYKNLSEVQRLNRPEILTMMGF